jgi:hypothetical protein
MGNGYFTDRGRAPTAQEIQSALGTKYPLWERLIQFVDVQFQASGRWSFWGGGRNGWNVRYRAGGKALNAPHPQRVRVMAQVVLGKAEAERALRLRLGEKVSQIVRETPQLRDGRWLYIDVLTTADAEDVEQLVLLKRRPATTTNP